jgi:hypothetical protein
MARQGGAANENPQPLRGVICIALQLLCVSLADTVLFCPQGCCFSLSGLSAESEKTNQLCVLCALSAAGGKSMSKDE